MAIPLDRLAHAPGNVAKRRQFGQQGAQTLGSDATDLDAGICTWRWRVDYHGTLTPRSAHRGKGEFLYTRRGAERAVHRCVYALQRQRCHEGRSHVTGKDKVAFSLWVAANLEFRPRVDGSDGERCRYVRRGFVQSIERTIWVGQAKGDRVHVGTTV